MGMYLITIAFWTIYSKAISMWSYGCMAASTTFPQKVSPPNFEDKIRALLKYSAVRNKLQPRLRLQLIYCLFSPLSVPHNFRHFGWVRENPQRWAYCRSSSLLLPWVREWHDTGGEFSAIKKEGKRTFMHSSIHLAWPCMVALCESARHCNFIHSPHSTIEAATLIATFSHPIAFCVIR